MSTERISPLRCALSAAQVVLMLILQGIPTGSFDKPYCLLSLALALAGTLSPVASMVFGAVCGALCDLSGGGAVGYYAVSAALICASISQLLRRVLQNSLLTGAVLRAAAVTLIIGLYFLLFRLFQPGLLPSYLRRAALTYACIFPLWGLNSALWRQCRE